ncbi:hypothetical protein DRJ16_07220 [Candidatus Woesearchaeota archaeon]|nr:MAG: hypothetical protein DRJ16_07220 [Candidatus Woesearchaeota archaeon]
MHGSSSIASFHALQVLLHDSKSDTGVDSPILMRISGGTHRYMEECIGTDHVFTVTQNVDNLERVAGATRIFQVHLSFTKMFCVNCGQSLSLGDVSKAKLPFCPPICMNCGSHKMRTGCLLFHESRNPFHAPFSEAKAAMQELGRGDVLVIVGTSAKVKPARSFPSAIKDGCGVIEVNTAPRPLFFVPRASLSSVRDD